MPHKSDPITAPAHNAPHIGHYELHPPTRTLFIPCDERDIGMIRSLALALGWNVKRAKLTETKK
jgi:hypothetical protein